jgi:hypothetical protein
MSNGDIGPGLPTQGNVHLLARQHHPVPLSCISTTTPACWPMVGLCLTGCQGSRSSPATCENRSASWRTRNWAALLTSPARWRCS